MRPPARARHCDVPIEDPTNMNIAARRTRMRPAVAVHAATVAAVAFAFALAPSSAVGQSTTAAPPTTPASPTAPSPSVLGYGDHDKTCMSWTDGCVSCRMGLDNAVACSNPGIACQPQTISCVTRRPEPAKKPTKEPAKEPAK